ncbi:hypothetical protein [Methylibium sp. Root1272]|uniref:hypothetical protein n=1 Tax=Methylibium sp. Root1272 TaxID=1736441 RepID=UPI0006F52975|nr:hypothetical protein [Methylibium sp. Root1272]KQW76586.1 hypothetical protein ASC67_02740 [Methylibium sp. Root1272]
MELLTFAIAANEIKVFKRAGRYFEIIDSAYALTVDFYDENGGKSDGMLGALSGLFVSGPFTEFTVSNGAAAQTVTLMIHEGRGGSRRQPGVVRVVDENVEKTNRETQYFGLSRRVGSATKVGLVGVIAGSKSIVIKRFSYTAAAAGICTLFSGTGAPTDSYLTLGVRNKKIGAADAQALRFSALAATINPTGVEVPGVVLLMTIYAAANVLTEFPLTTPLVVPAGYCFGISGPAINTEAGFGFDVEEL